MCAKSITGRTQASWRRCRTRRRASRARARGPSPRRRMGRARPSPRAARGASPSCSTTSSSACSRVAAEQNPGWKTTTSAPAAVAIPAVWSSIPSACLCFFCVGMARERERAARAPRARSPARGRLAEPRGPRVVHPEAALEVELARRVAALEQDLDGRLRATPGRGSAQGRSGSLPCADGNGRRMPSDGGPTLFDMAKHPPASTCSSSTSTSGSPTSGARPARSPSGTSRSWRRSCAPRTARATATR